MITPKKQQNSAVNRILIIELIVMILLMIFVTKTVSSQTRKNSIDHMATITDERAKIIDSFVQDAKKTLTAYSRASQITDLLKNPDSKTAQATAQKYTEIFSKDIQYLEGIYCSEWNTHVLAHTNSKVVGLITRKEPEPLKQLQDAMLAAGNGVYDTGIILSPASNKQIVSMYKAVYDDDNNPIGLVGIGIFTDGLIKNLDTLSIHGIEESFYSMVNVDTNKYIFHSNSYLVQSEATQPEILNLCERIRNYNKNGEGEQVVSGNFEYRFNGKKYVSCYSYMKEHNWILMLDDPKSEVYKLTYSMRAFLTLFGVLLLGLMFIFAFINKRQESINKKLSSQIVKTEKTKQSLTTAMFKDILTEANNRVSFSMDTANLKPVPNGCYYFIYVNISAFSLINTNYGNDAGDQVLLSTVDALRKVFQNGTVYRTGSDEFVIVIQSEDTTASYNSIINAVNTAHAILLTPHETPAGQVTAEYKIAVAKKSDEINSSIISALKELTDRNGDAVFGQVQYIDLDQHIS